MKKSKAERFRKIRKYVGDSLGRRLQILVLTGPKFNARETIGVIFHFPKTMDGTVNCWYAFSGIRCRSIGFFYHEFQTLRWGIDGIPNRIRQNNVAQT